MARWKKKKMESFFNNEFLEYDIICLQEHFFLRSPILRWMGPPHIMKEFSSVHSPYPSSIAKVVSAGLSIYTRFDIAMSKFHPFECAVGMDKHAEKGILYAKISYGPGLFLHVFNSHLQSGGSARASLVRMDQLQTVYDFIYSNTQFDRHPIMLMGDFNENVSLSTLQIVRKFATISQSLNTYKHRCLDYIVVQQDRMIMLGHDQTHSFDNFSDHSGVSVVVFPN